MRLSADYLHSLSELANASSIFTHSVNTVEAHEQISKYDFGRLCDNASSASILFIVNLPENQIGVVSARDWLSAKWTLIEDFVADAENTFVAEVENTFGDIAKVVNSNLIIPDNLSFRELLKVVGKFNTDHLLVESDGLIQGSICLDRAIAR